MSASAVHGVLVSRNRVLWAGSASYRGPDDLGDVIARLASECTRPVSHARVVIAPDLAQLRCIDPAPPLRAAQARRHVALHGSRLFRNGHGALVTDALLIAVEPGRKVLVSAAASESIMDAIIRGCDQAGIVVDCIGPAVEVLAFAIETRHRDGHALVPGASGTLRLELARGRTYRWRRMDESASTSWERALGALGAEAPHFAAAFAATRCAPDLDLIPPKTHARARGTGASRVRRLSIAAVALWLGAFALFGLRLAMAERTANRELEALALHLREAIRARQELGAGLAAIETMQRADARRSRMLTTIATLTGALSDSVVLASLRLNESGLLQFSGYAPAADRVVAAIERVRGVTTARLEGPPTRQSFAIGARVVEWDRFALSARLRGTR